MTTTRLIDRAMRIVMRKLLHKGIDAGVERASRRGQDGDPQARPDPIAKAQTAETKKRMKQSLRIARRMGRF